MTAPDLKETTARLREMLAKAEEARALYGRNNLATFDLECRLEDAAVNALPALLDAAERGERDVVGCERCDLRAEMGPCPTHRPESFQFWTEALASADEACELRGEVERLTAALDRGRVAEEQLRELREARRVYYLGDPDPWYDAVDAILAAPDSTEAAAENDHD